MKGSQYSSKFDQPDNIQKLIFKLPYNMRERWRRVVDDIMELQGRPVKFDDLLSFIDREARIATNPVFGQITEGSKILKASMGTVQKLLPKSRELSLAAQVNADHGLNTEVNRSINIDTSQYTPSIAAVRNSCCFCNLNHALEDCRSLRSRPYQERIQFIASKNLCFGCLSDKHIARDCPQRKSCKVKNSEHGGPYASRTRIGWIVNGPLGRHHQGSHAMSFFVKADTELQQMVEDYYNLNFDESIADNRTGLSQDECPFMACVEESTLLKDGHYEIPLPFKDRQYTIPNNRIQAEQRASWLKKRLEKNPRLLDDYKAFVEDIVAKGYTQKVPPHQRESGYQGKTWFIPHHGVYHPHKPGKIRVVFNCSAKYHGKCVNGLLLKGPDLTNSLLGVLTRFRQDRVAVMADIDVPPG